MMMHGWDIDPSFNVHQLCFGGWKDGRSWMLFFGPFSLIIDPPEGPESRQIVQAALDKCPMCGGLVRRAPTQGPP